MGKLGENVGAKHGRLMDRGKEEEEMEKGRDNSSQWMSKRNGQLKDLKSTPMNNKVNGKEKIGSGQRSWPLLPWRRNGRSPRRRSRLETRRIL